MSVNERIVHIDEHGVEHESSWEELETRLLGALQESPADPNELSSDVDALVAGVQLVVDGLSHSATHSGQAVSFHIGPPASDS